jgi:hypothetical protein
MHRISRSARIGNATWNRWIEPQANRIETSACGLPDELRRCQFERGKVCHAKVRVQYVALAPVKSNVTPVVKLHSGPAIQATVEPTSSMTEARASKLLALASALRCLNRALAEMARRHG